MIIKRFGVWLLSWTTQTCEMFVDYLRKIRMFRYFFYCNVIRGNGQTKGVLWDHSLRHLQIKIPLAWCLLRVFRPWIHSYPKVWTAFISKMYILPIAQVLAYIWNNNTWLRYVCGEIDRGSEKPGSAGKVQRSVELVERLVPWQKIEMTNVHLVRGPL